MKIPFLNKKLEKSTVTISDKVLVKGFNDDLIAQVVRVFLFNQRQGTSSVKTRAFVRGGGRKPWKQKGTGRARQGSRRAPQFVGGARVHGPSPKSWNLSINAKMKKLAAKMAFSKKVTDNTVWAVEFDTPKAPSTKKVVPYIKKVSENDETTLVVTNKEPILVKSLNNIKNVRTSDINTLNTFEILGSYNIILTPEALKNLETRFI